MSISSRVSMKFAKSNGDNVSMSYGNIKQDVTDANVKSLMECIVANGVIFEKVPAVIKSAEIITTEKTAVDLS